MMGAMMQSGGMTDRFVSSTSLLRSSKLVLCGKGSSCLIPRPKRAGPAPAQAAQEGLPDKAP